MQALTASLTLLATGLLIPLADSHGDLSVFVGCVFVATALGTLFVIPIRFLPAIALIVTLLVPTETTVPHLFEGSALGGVPLIVWMIRAPRSGQTPTALRLLACLLGVWFVLSYVFAPLHTHRGAEWLVTATIVMVITVISTPQGLKPGDLRALFLAIATVLGIYALLEGFALHHNVLFASLFEHTTWWRALHYNASYRVTTLLGHPLFNGLVFSAAAVLAASNLVQQPKKPLVALARFIILVGATDATHSRGADIALAIGVGVVIAFSRGRGQGWRTRKLVLTISCLLGAVVLVYGLQARDESREGQSSAQTRIAVIKRASEALHHVEPFGAGPGESDAYRKAKRLPGWETDLENSYAELIVSLGPIGVLLVLALLIAVVAFGLQNELVRGEAAALLTILVSMAGFNAIEGHKPVMILIALLVIVILTAPRHKSIRRAHNGRAATRPLSRRRVVIAG
ncbi:MAG TPA: O-antigen ligase family protein [Solirubrobacteraceae bacterium]|nr:O-antigen ligase family protein [Solirubrobacteraceae bacterium]